MIIRFRKMSIVAAGALALIAGGTAIYFNLRPDEAAIAYACAEMIGEGLPRVADDVKQRFLGKVSKAKARCRGGERAVAHMAAPWVDWSNYWGVGDASSISDRFRPSSRIFNRAKWGVEGALFDLQYQRMELIKFNLFDNLTYKQYATDETRPILVWPEMRLPKDDPNYGSLDIREDGKQLCQGELIRFRTLTGICNDIRNPAMGSTGQLFARNVAFEATYPELGLNDRARNRHGDRIGLLKPDPQVISRKLFTRAQTNTPDCNHGRGLPSHNADCSYKKAPFFNVLAAFWIQFMTHDWFSHLNEARNDETKIMTALGCSTERVRNEVVPLSPERVAELGCRPEDRIDAALVADSDPPSTFKHEGVERASRAYKTTRNTVTAWWDASQIYGWDERSRRRVRRDPFDPAKLMLVAADNGHGLLPTFRRRACRAGDGEGDCDPIQPEWTGQEAVAFPDNWSVGLSFYHNLFAREHNTIIDEFRRMARKSPDADSGLRNPERPDDVVTYNEISNDELFEVARLIVAVEIAKIHTIEWTTQLLYNEPLSIGMDSNWSGVFEDFPLAAEVSERLVKRLSESSDPKMSKQISSAFSAGPGIVGRGSSRKFPAYLPDQLSWDRWSIENPDDVNGGTNHFEAPFNFPEDFPSVYRLHALVPDMLEYRDFSVDPNAVQEYMPVVETFRGKATTETQKRGLANMALTMGRQRLGLLLLRNHPQFLQNLDLRPRIDTTIDVPALDIIRDRERGTPRFNEFRRQIGLRQLTSFDDFIDLHLPKDSPERSEQAELVEAIREVYGRHRCDASKVITDAQLDEKKKPIDDCLGHPDGTMVDNIEDVDLVVGFHAETTRPHGFAISETQFLIFILNASRRLFADRFFTSSFRSEFYTKLGIDWVMNNGPSGKQWEKGAPNGHKQEVSPLKRVLLRAIPDLELELAHVVNVFDPWARDRGKHYSLAWKPRPDAASDPAFGK